MLCALNLRFQHIEGIICMKLPALSRVIVSRRYSLPIKKYGGEQRNLKFIGAKIQV